MPGGSACFAVLLTLFFLLSALLIGKRIFLKTRKSKHPFPCSIAADFSAHSSASILPSSADRGSTKAAFLVGFFGSPAWETSVTNLVDKSRCSEYKQSSFSYHLSTGSRRSKYTRTINSSLTDKGSPLDLAKPRSLSVSTIGDIRSLHEIRDATHLGKQRKSRSLKLPTRPPKAYTGSVPSRRFSMPSVGRNDTSASHRTRTSSLKSSTTRCSDLSSSSFPGNSSLRLVEPTDGPDYPLPLSPHESECRLSPPDAFAASSPISKHGKTPLLPVPQATSARPEHKTQSMNTLRISHPYALASGSNSSVSFVNKITSRAGQTSTNVASNMKSEQQGSVARRKPLSPVLGSINLSPLSVPYMHTTCLTAPASPPQPHLETPVISSKIKQKAHRPSTRVRRSPAIGPSPLRAMILPDPSDPSITVRTSVSQIESRHFNPTLDYSRLGLGFPSTPHTATRGLYNTIPPVSERAPDRNQRSGSLMEAEDDPNLLLGIIQELVEETSQWDRSLFKDKNFKAMIDNSKHSSFTTNHPHSRVVTEDSSYRSVGIVEEESAEFDLSLLGLDIFRSDGETFIPGAEDKVRVTEGDGGDIVSCWEDKRWFDHDPPRHSVGIAC